MINKPVANLSTTERKLLEKHAITGQAILMGLEPLHTSADLIRWHHETYDGKGYPDRLQGEDIPLGARILAVVNEYDGLCSGALLGDQLSVIDAREFVEKRSGRRYDPVVVDALIKVLEGRGSADAAIRELHLRPNDLLEGMVLSRDLFSFDGVLLLTRGYKLTEQLIAKLISFAQDEEHKLVIHVLAEDEPSGQADAT